MPSGHHFHPTAICLHRAVVAVASLLTHMRGEVFEGEKSPETTGHLFPFKAGDFHRFRALQDFFGVTKINRLREHVRNPSHIWGVGRGATAQSVSPLC